MVSMKDVRAANNSLSSQSFTAVFAGSTSGIGLGAIEALLKSTKSSKVYVVGRSQSRFAPTLAKLQDLNKSAEIIFIEAQVSLLKEVDRVCAIIKAQESTIDLLWLSQGGLSALDSELTAEGLISGFAIKNYSRTLFMHKLMPLLNKSSDPRVISVLSAGQEGVVNTTDFGLLDPKNYGFIAAAKQGVSMMSLVMREMSLENPKVSFIHTNPGMVNTDVHHKLADTMTGYLTPFSWLLRWALIPLMHSFGCTAEEAGEMGLYEVTNESYSASTGVNFFRLDPNAKDAGASSTLSKYENDGTQRRVWEHYLEVFDKVLAQ
jgi:NAD(P)-dependent dehydrogenase (short-subunit alcohol dehydrogenase family)